MVCVNFRYRKGTISIFINILIFFPATPCSVRVLSMIIIGIPLMERIIAISRIFSIITCDSPTSSNIFICSESLPPSLLVLHILSSLLPLPYLLQSVSDKLSFFQLYFYIISIYDEKVNPHFKKNVGKSIDFTGLCGYF